MCGRYALSKSPDEIIEEFEITTGYAGPILPADWNITPTRNIYIINAIPHTAQPTNQTKSSSPRNSRELSVASWGLIAPWSKDRASAIRSQSQAINARSESVDEKPTFRHAFRRHRCLIPADGYYEWATELGRYPTKQPFYIHAKDSHLLALAGIFDQWTDPSDPSQVITSAAIITRPAEGRLANIHNRMPTFLPEQSWDEWLDPSLTDASRARALLSSISSTELLVAEPVATLVNSIRNNGPQLTVPVQDIENQTLF
jgi:putative SOS response-associated peptidase YedK